MAVKKIQSALISVFYKDNLEPIIALLKEQGVKIYSTGGTQKFIEEQGANVTAVEDLTGYPSIFGGRVKTLHPMVFGGILHRRDHAGDQDQAAEYGIPPIDLVIVDLYPFEETVASGASEADIIEKIDIGGISLIRAAAKNFKDVTIVASKDQYTELEERLKANGGGTTIEDRKYFAAQAFKVSSNYDTHIFNYFNQSGVKWRKSGRGISFTTCLVGMRRLSLVQRTTSTTPYTLRRRLSFMGCLWSRTSSAWPMGSRAGCRS
jgi:phosphoribosylaminoimidazolecarboxamide formyltransferase / IMP cyclohydrolase